ncbi:MAG: DUF4097 family beta strand repeat-containing protein [bacterium]|nr:DUF4097 family beta strand repeat-containing protein [bacterium]
MGKAIKRMLIGAAALFILGIILCSISVVAGVNTSNVTMFGKDIATYMNFDQTYTQEITALDVDFDYGMLYVKEGEAFRVEAKNVPEEKFKVEVDKNGTLKVSEKRNKWFNIELDGFPFFFFDNNKDKRTTITIYLPKNTTLKSCNIDVSAGKASLENISAETGTLEVSAGQIVGNNIKLQKSSKLELGAGSMELSKAILNDCDMDISAGELIVDGTLTGKTEATCGAGSIKITTDLEEKDYNYKCDASAGSIKVNGNHVKHESNNNNATNSFDLDCSAGEIKVTTK